SAPPIPGLYFTPSLLLPQPLADALMSYCLQTYFTSPNINQIMLFGRFSPGNTTSSFPPPLNSLLSTLSDLLRPTLPAATHALLFPTSPTQARQAILNLYTPGEGISPHVDLLGRFGDGIIGVSFGSGCVMGFQRDAGDSVEAEGWDLYLPARSLLVLSEDARYKWTHGIEKCCRDYVAEEGGSGGRWIERGVRLSITFRWLLPGADVVG
ncbi:hypothetical protein BD779DRAFT_1430257, partial [Infundibulicybe gibba]